jgi:hypothetical protein
MFDLSELSDWVTSNWFELGSLLIQCVILVVLVGYGRAMLRSRASQEQLEQLEVRQTSSLGLGAISHAEPRHTESVFHRAANSCRRIVRWLQAPAGS